MTKRSLLLTGIGVVLLLAVSVVAWRLLSNRGVVGEPIVEVTRAAPAPLPTIFATVPAADGGATGETAVATPSATPAIIGDLGAAAGDLGLDLDNPPTLDELLAQYPELETLLINLNLTDEERLREVYAQLLALYENEGLAGLHEFMLASGILEALNLDSIYVDMLLAYEEGGVTAVTDLARSRRLLTDNDEIRIVLILDTTDITAIEPALQAEGIIVLDHYGNEVEVGLPLAFINQWATSEDGMVKLVELAHLPHVIGVQAPEPRPLNQSSTPGQGPGVTGAEAWHRAGYTGEGVRVGILDPDGFGGFLALLGSDLPDGSRIFIPDWQDADYLHQSSGPHGTACAEIVYEMAPGVTLYLAHTPTSRTEARAVDWMLANEVQIISYSAGSIIEPTDGSGPSVRIAQNAIDRGVLWVNSAGNYAEAHLELIFTDEDEDGWLEFPHGRELLPFDPHSPYVSFGLRWDDVWQGATENYDLYVFRETDDARDVEIFASQRAAQHGRSADNPAEVIDVLLPDGRDYYIAIQAENISRPGRLHLLGYGADFAYSMPAGSLAAPADGVGVLAVGATYWRNDALESYSSQGPTSDGRLKPDISAPARVSNASYGSFSGTSASSPHVAGAAALVLSAYPTATGPELRDYLLRHAVDKGITGHDNEFGAGRLALPAPSADAEPPPAEGAATAIVQQISVRHNAYIAGVKGLQIFVDFDIDNYQGQNGRLVATFYNEETGSALRDGNGQYADADGQVAVDQAFTPRYQRTRFTAVDLFMPYTELEMGSGTHELSFIITVQEADGTILERSGATRFQLNNPGDTRPQAAINTINVTHNVTRDGQPGMDINVSLAIANHRDQTAELSAYFYFDSNSNRPLRDFNGQYTTTDGNVAVGQWFIPGSNNARYDNLQLFMPYAELHMEPGDYHELKFYLILWSSEGTQLTNSSWIPFWYDAR